MPWDDLSRAANKVKARAKIQRSTHLNYRCPKGKRPLKMSLNFKNDQTDKKVLQAKASPAKQGSEAEKSSEKARKEKKKEGPSGTAQKA